MKITPAQVERFLKTPTAEIILLHGADAGRIGAVAAELARAAGGDAGVQTLDAAETAKDPSRLYEGAAEIGLFGGGQATRVRDAGDKLTKTMKAFLERPGKSNRVIVEAGDLPSKSSLRKLFEAAGNAAVVGFPAPEGATLAALGKARFAAHAKTLGPGAEQILAERLPRDTLAANAEIDKLLVWLGSETACPAEAVALLVGDAAEDEIDAPAFAAADGDPVGTIRTLRRLSASGESAIGVLRLAQRHFQRLHAARADVQAGMSVDAATTNLKPPVFWKRKAQVEAQIRLWGLPQIERALGLLTEAEGLCKSTGYPEDAVAAHALFTIACAARQGKALAAAGARKAA